MPLSNTMDKFYFGDVLIDALYAGDQKIWPAGGGEFNPLSLPGLSIWLDATTIGLGHDAEIYNWANLGSGEDAVLYGGTARMQNFGPNGRPVVAFWSGQGRVRMYSTGVEMEFTLAYVARMSGAVAGRIVNGIYEPANILFGFWNGFMDVGYDNGFGSTSSTQKAQDQNWHLYSADGTVTPAIEDRLFSDGMQLGTIATSQGWKGTFSISGYAPTAADETPNCEVAEVLLYNRKLSDADREQVEDYLRFKWGVGLS